MVKRVILIVLDSVGIGSLPDAYLYGDEGANTFGHLKPYFKEDSLKNLRAMGFSNIEGVDIFPDITMPKGSYGRLQEQSKGKDTTTGHWEIMGEILDKPFPVYPKGFPEEVIQLFEQSIGSKILGNKPASGTQIIEELGEEHQKTGYPIVYTSADSVFQIAAHEKVISLNKLYQICETARKLLKDEHAVSRVIARPFEGEPGNYRRTPWRRDFSLTPKEDTALDKLKNMGYLVKSVGKINDIFGGKGITHSVHTKNNMEGIDKTIEWIQEDFTGLLFTNLVDFDTLYGHRNDAMGYARALEDFDERLPQILSALKSEDVLMITADHGCDPTYPGTDHTREYVPLIVYGNPVRSGVHIGTRGSFSDIAATILEAMKIEKLKNGNSFWKKIEKP